MYVCMYVYIYIHSGHVQRGMTTTPVMLEQWSTEEKMHRFVAVACFMPLGCFLSWLWIMMPHWL